MNHLRTPRHLHPAAHILRAARIRIQWLPRIRKILERIAAKALIPVKPTALGLRGRHIAGLTVAGKHGAKSLVARIDCLWSA